MGLFKRGPVWWMRLTFQGKQIRLSTETTEKKLAIRIYDKVKGEIAEGKWFEKPEANDCTFEELMEKYMVEYSAVNKAPGSYRRDKSLKAHLVKAFGKLNLIEITPKLISDYKLVRRNDGVSPRTINYELTLMSHAFNLAIKDWGLSNDNPVKKVSKEKVHNQMERWLTLEEENLLLETSPLWLQHIILFAINTGFRESEILDLRWSQVDLFRKTITISEQKNKGVDTLPINKAVLDILSKRSATTHLQTDYVFPSAKNTRIGNRNLIRAFDAAVEKAGIADLRFHDLRHTFATRLVQAGVDFYTVQKLGRWKNFSMVQRYAHHYVESLRSGVEVMDNLKLAQI